jgi:dienelactone hydrolase
LPLARWSPRLSKLVGAAAVVAAASGLAGLTACAAADPLPEVNLAPGVTVSGLSSGGFFAHQFHVAFSENVEGAAILAGGPYACAEDIPSGLWANPAPRVATAVAVCTHIGRDSFGGFSFFLPSGPDADASLEEIEDAFAAGAIDDPANLANDRVWLFVGGQDEVVPEETMAALEALYRELGVTGDALASERIGGAGHGFPVEEVGESEFGVPECGTHGLPFLIDCDFDAAGALLRHLAGHLDEFWYPPSWEATP